MKCGTVSEHNAPNLQCIRMNNKDEIQHGATEEICFTNKSKQDREKKEADDIVLHILSFWTYFADAAPLLNIANHHENIPLHFWPP